MSITCKLQLGALLKVERDQADLLPDRRIIDVYL
jgi:hypothetical protein